MNMNKISEALHVTKATTDLNIALYDCFANWDNSEVSTNLEIFDGIVARLQAMCHQVKFIGVKRKTLDEVVLTIRTIYEGNHSKAELIFRKHCSISGDLDVINLFHPHEQLAMKNYLMANHVGMDCWVATEE